MRVLYHFHAHDFLSENCIRAKIIAKKILPVDNLLRNLIKEEHVRIEGTANCIASESYPSQDVIDAAANVFTAKYQMGLPYSRDEDGAIDRSRPSRLYAGTRVYDQVELRAIDELLKLFGLRELGDSWASVQPLSGSHANLSVYHAFLGRDVRAVGFNADHGGHFSHGDSRSITQLSANWVQYGVTSSGHIDYDQIETLCKHYQPRLLQVGGSTIGTIVNFERIRSIADACNVPYVMADIAHTAGLVAARVGKFQQDAFVPWKWCDIVTTTTHKTLRGISGGAILLPDGRMLNSCGVSNDAGRVLMNAEVLEAAICPGTTAKSPGNTVLAKAVGFAEGQTDAFRDWAQRVVDHAVAIDRALRREGIPLFGVETESHCILIDTGSLGFSGAQVQEALETANIITNACSLPLAGHDLGGVRIGSTALTCRLGFDVDSANAFAKLLARAIKSTNDESALRGIGAEVVSLMKQFPIYGAVSQHSRPPDS